MQSPKQEPETGAAEAPLRDGRVVQPSPGDVRPLYSVGRVVQAQVLDAERILNDAVQAKQELETQSAALLEATRAEAESILAKAQAEADQVRESARQAGLAEARDEAMRVVRSVSEELERLRKSYPIDVQRMAFRYAEKVLNVELQTRPETIVQLCSKVLERAKQYQRIRFRLHPEDLPFVQAALDGLKQQLVFSGDVGCVEDRDLPRHGVRIETEMGTYLGSVEEQLRPLRDALGLEAAAQPDEGAQDG